MYKIPIAAILFTGMLAFLSTSWSGKHNLPEIPEKDYFSMKGERIIHTFTDKSDSLSGPEIIELRDENGIPVWFGRRIYKDVCMSGVCKMIRLWLFWDGAGNYLGLQVSEEDPLTKSDHTEFILEDYEKLDQILKDTASVMKSLNQEDLVIIPDSISPYTVDGYTAATQPQISDAVVKNAVFTCYTLWHTVYGPVQGEIARILDKNVSRSYLSHTLKHVRPEYQLWTIGILQEHPEFHADLYSGIIDCLTSDNADVAEHALEYFGDEYLSDPDIQLEIATVMGSVTTSSQLNYEILRRFIGNSNVHHQTVSVLLNKIADDQLDPGLYNLVLRLITKEHFADNVEISNILHSLSNDENPYIRNVTRKKLDQLAE